MCLKCVSLRQSEKNALSADSHRSMLRYCTPPKLNFHSFRCWLCPSHFDLPVLFSLQVPNNMMLYAQVPVWFFFRCRILKNGSHLHNRSLECMKSVYVWRAICMFGRLCRSSKQLSKPQCKSRGRHVIVLRLFWTHTLTLCMCGPDLKTLP